MNWNRQLPTRTIAMSAIASLVAFPILVVAANLAQRDTYNAASEAISNLALGRNGWLMTLAFVSLGSGTILMAAVVRRSVPRAIVGPAFLTAGACTTLLSAVFQTDADGSTSTVHGTIHIALGVGSFVLVIAAISSSAVSFIRSDSWRGFGIASAVWAVVALGAVILTFVLPASLFGIGQRAFLTTAVCWMLVTSALVIRQEKNGLDSGQRARNQHPAAFPHGVVAGPPKRG